MRIDVAIVDSVPLGVDTPEDLETRARACWAVVDSNAAAGRNRAMTKMKVAFQGEPGANSHLAIREVYPDAEAAALRDLRGRLRRDQRRARPTLGMIPIENSIAGRVADIHHLMPDVEPAHHRRALPAGAPPAAGAEGRDAQRPSRRSRATSTRSASAARSSASSASSRSSPPTPPARRARSPRAGDKTRAAIATRLAAEIYGLDILERERRGRGAQHHALRRAVARDEVGAARQRHGRHDLRVPGRATCRPRSTRRWAASPPTAST